MYLLVPWRGPRVRDVFLLLIHWFTDSLIQPPARPCTQWISKQAGKLTEDVLTGWMSRDTDSYWDPENKIALAELRGCTLEQCCPSELRLISEVGGSSAGFRPGKAGWTCCSALGVLRPGLGGRASLSLVSGPAPKALPPTASCRPHPIVLHTRAAAPGRGARTRATHLIPK